MGKDYLKSGSPQFEARQRRWRHTALLGHLARAEIFVRMIWQKDTCTKEAKIIALRIENDLVLLRQALATRKDSQS